MTTKSKKQEYLCSICKRVTITTAETPPQCCGQEMQDQQEKFHTSETKKKASKTASSRTKKTTTRRTTRSRTKKVEKKAPDIYTSGTYNCPACGFNKEVELAEPTTDTQRCPQCFVALFKI